MEKRMDIIRRDFIAIAMAWTLLLLGLFIWGVLQAHDRTDTILISQARPFLNQIITTRSWNARHGGVYVPITKDNPPNPYLKVPHRDIETTDGMKLTLINPAYMTRQLAELALKENKVAFHLTSERPIRPANAPESWEREAMKQLNKPGDEFSARWQDDKGRHLFRFMQPVWLSKECLKCHTQRGFSEGDLSGALSVTLPAEAAISKEQESMRFEAGALTLIWLLGLLGLALSSRDIRKLAREQEVLIERLEHTLQGLVPICSSCKSIRSDSGEWEKLERYISEHSEAEFSHGICPSCTEKLYGDFLRSKGKQ